MRVHRLARAAALAEAPLGSLRGCASKPRFLCLNASSRGLVGGAGRGLGTQRYFSQSRIARASVAESV
jgi:elongation factor G